MRVTLRHFALIRETIGLKTEEREFAPGETIGELYDRLATDHPRLAPLKRSVMMMANEAYVPADYPLGDGDEIGLDNDLDVGAQHLDHHRLARRQLRAMGLCQRG